MTIAKEIDVTQERPQTALKEVQPVAGGEMPDTRLRLLLSAEREFSREGIETASLRKIALSSGNGNHNAVKYYFTNRLGLVHALLTYRVQQMETSRLAMLDAAEQAGTLDDLHTLWQIYCLPQCGLFDENGRFPYARFLLQFYAFLQDGTYRNAISQVVSISPAIRRTRQLMIDRLPVEPALADSRIALCHGMFLTMLVRSETEFRDGLHTPKAKRRIADTLDMMTRAISSVPAQHDVELPALLLDLPKIPPAATQPSPPVQPEKLEEENAMLKRLVAELSLERARQKN